MTKRIAAIGDVHGCHEEFETLLKALSWHSLDEIWHLGDVVDRGPHSGKAIELCRKYNLKGVMGNHDDVIIKHWDTFKRTGALPKNPDKARTIKEITQEDVDYLTKLPYLHVFDDLNTVLVHGGLFPNMPLYAQPQNVCRVQMVHPFHPGKSKWWGNDAALMFKEGKTEEHWKAEGWDRWYRLYDGQHNVIFGHSTWAQPMTYKTQQGALCIGIDTGSCFGGSITTAILGSNIDEIAYLSVKAKKCYYKAAHRNFWEE